MTHHHLLIAAHESLMWESLNAQRDAGRALGLALSAQQKARRLLAAIDQT